MSWFKKNEEPKREVSPLAATSTSSIATRRLESSTTSYTSTRTETKYINGVRTFTNTTSNGGGPVEKFRGAPMRSAMWTPISSDFRDRNNSIGSSLKLPPSPSRSAGSVSPLKQDARLVVPPNNTRRASASTALTFQPKIPTSVPTTVTYTPIIKDMEGLIKIKVTKTNQRYDKNNKVPTYSTYGKRRGKVIMINNVMFKKDPENKNYRKGADIDEQNVKDLFKKMGFDVQSYRNLTKKNMVDQLRNYTKNKDLKNYDINVVIMMSHGFGDSRGSTDISGTDNQLLPISQVIEMFDSQQCPNLNNIPKIFIFQCCRGEKRQNTEHDAIPFVPPKAQCDILIAYSTIPGYVSNRNPRLGTWYIQAICKVFMEHAHDTDVEGLLKMVEDKLNVLAVGTGYSQTSSYENRGFKTCYLHPK